MTMGRLSLLVKAKEIANYIQEHKWRYSQNVSNTWGGAKKKKISNCASYVCYCLQELKLLKPGQLFYCNKKSQLVFKGTGTKAQILKHYKLIKVGKTPAQYKEKLLPGDICFYRLHTNIFAGVNEKEKMVWWDAGKAGTNTKKTNGIFNNIHRIINSNQKIVFILRWKR